MPTNTAKAKHTITSLADQASAVRRSVWRELKPLKERLMADSQHESHGHPKRGSAVKASSSKAKKKS
jgi:hypothetical protein